MRASARALVLGTLVAMLGTAPAAEPRRRLVGTVPPIVAALGTGVPAPPHARLGHVTVYLGLRDRTGLDALVAAQGDRRTPRFGRWLDAGELADRFGARRPVYERVRRWLVGQGLRVVRDSPHRVAITVAGSVASVEAALGTRLRVFRHGGGLHRAPVVEPSLPASIARSVRGVLGLDDLPGFRPLVLLPDGERALGPRDFAAVYGVQPLWDAGLTGVGRSIAIVARSNFRDSDIQRFSELFGIPLAPVRKLADPARDPGVLSADGEETEVLLDTQWAGALAPGATLNVVISTPDGDIPEALVKAVEDREGDVVSISFGLCEQLVQPLVVELFDAFYAIANAQGQTVVVASGDAGATDCAPFDRVAPGVNALAASPHAIAVGGTSFALGEDGTPPEEPVERVWSDAAGAGGGGESLRFARPRHQLGPGLPPLMRGRAIPDLALAASPLAPGYVIVEGGTPTIIGGTSAGAPALAGILALIAERRDVRGLGQLLPSLYRLGRDQALGRGAAVFRDLVEGTNALGSGPGFAAGPGFDLATGWGAPDAAALAAGLEAPGPCEPAIGCLVPARGTRRRACAAAWLVEQDGLATRRGVAAGRQTCRDGDPGCDIDGVADGRCTVNVALCLNVFDFRAPRLGRNGLPVCEPGVVRRVRVRRPGRRSRDPVAAANREALTAAVRGLPDLPTRLRSACTATTPVVVAVPDGATAHAITLEARVTARRGRRRAVVTLGCER